MKDLFGNEIAEAPEETYESYINSPKWKRIRAQKLEQVGYQCESCHLSRFSVTLEVHHLHYDTLGHEGMADLQVLCPRCHENADEERKTNDELRRMDEKEHSALYQGFKKWLKNGDYKVINSDVANAAKQRYLIMLYNKSGSSYKLDLRILGYKDYDPEWTPA